MLSGLTIKNFAIIDDLKISFQDGLTVLTGETGAGKSIIIEAVNLLLGSRASSELVRAGCKNAELEAYFDIDSGSNAATILEDQGMDHSEGLMIRRIISATGSSRVFINSRQSTLELLKQLTRDLAGISSQHAHQGLLKEENHLDILDKFTDTAALKNEVKTLYQTILPLKKKIIDLKERLFQQKKEQDFLEFQINEISEASILPNEDELLEKKRDTLLNASKIFEAVNRSIHEIYESEGSCIERLSSLRNRMEQLGKTDGPLLKIAGQISGTIYELQDISEGLRDYSATIDLDPASLESTDQRLDLVSKLKRKYGGSIDTLFQELADMEETLFESTQIENQIKIFEIDCKTYEEEIIQKAMRLSQLRKRASKQMSEFAQRELNVLEMGNARFEVDFKNTPSKDPLDIVTKEGEKIGSNGLDKVTFLLSPNPGEPLKPLVKIASGGELSRIVLALKAVLSKTKSLETLIFDEVDAGIGGATSEKVGLKLKQLSKKHQLICITHLAQIAKYGDHQFKIAKEVVDQRTFTTIVPLKTDTQRVEEIARMIGGSDISSTTLTHAKELLDQASS